MTAAYDPTYAAPSTGWTVQLNSGSGTGPSHMGVVAGELNYSSSAVNGIQQSTAVGGASGPLSASHADASGAGADSITLEKIVNRGNVPPSHPSDAAQGVY